MDVEIFLKEHNISGPTFRVDPVFDTEFAKHLGRMGGARLRATSERRWGELDGLPRIALHGAMSLNENDPFFKRKEPMDEWRCHLCRKTLEKKTTEEVWLAPATQTTRAEVKTTVTFLYKCGTTVVWADGGETVTTVGADCIKLP